MSRPSEDPFSFVTTEKQINDFASRRKPDPPELADFRRMYDSLLPQAEADGFGNVFSWVANRQAKQKDDDARRDYERRHESEFANAESVRQQRENAFGLQSENILRVRGAGAGAPSMRPPSARPQPIRPGTPPDRTGPGTFSRRPVPQQQMIAPPGYRSPEADRGRIVPDLDDDPFVRPIVLPNHDDIPRDPTLPPATTDPERFYEQLDESLFFPIITAHLRNRYGRPGLPSTVAGTRFLVEECKKVIGRYYPHVRVGKHETEEETEEIWYRPATDDGQKISGTAKGSSYADKRMAIEFKDKTKLGINLNTTTMKKKTPEMILRESRSFDRLRHNLRAAGNEVAEWFLKYHPDQMSEAEYRKKARDKCKEIMLKYLGPPQRFAGSF